MTVNPITREQATIVKDWRNDCRQALRTGWTTQRQQQEFVDGNMTGDYMYFGFDYQRAFGGLVNIDRRVRSAEIALIVDPVIRGKGFGTDCVDWILSEGFQTQNMKTIWGEVYKCGAVSFWDKVCKKYNANTARLINRTFWDGEHVDSMYFSIDRGEYERIQRDST